VNASPVLHFWSLAIEEQFYLAWPLLLSRLYLIARRTGRAAGGSPRGRGGCRDRFGDPAVRIGSTNLVRAYYGTDTRLSAPCWRAARAHPAAAATPCACGPTLAAVVRACVLGALLSSVRRSSTWARSRGDSRRRAGAILIVAPRMPEEARRKRMLSSPPFTYLGRISYGTYLWHWPIIVLATHERRIDPLPLFLIACRSLRCSRL